MTDVKVALYVIAMLSSAVCAVLLFRGYVQRRVRLLMWSGICFVGLTVNQVALFIDLVVYPMIDLRLMSSPTRPAAMNICSESLASSSSS